MVRSRWVVVAFVAGLSAGILAARMFDGSEPALAADGRSAPVDLPATPAAAKTASSFVAPADSSATAARAAPVHPATSEPAAADTRAIYPQVEFPPAEADGPILHPIDVSPEFRREFAERGAPGFPNQMAESHRAVEREDRDDNWSYPLEAEIQNSLIADTGVGSFTAHHVECRATRCEIGLSATKAQKGAMDAWTDGIAKQPWSAGMAVTSSSSIGDSNGATVVLIILQKVPVRRAT